MSAGSLTPGAAGTSYPVKEPKRETEGQQGHKLNMKFKNGWFNYETSTATALLNAYGAKRAERMVVDVDYICNMITSDLLDRHFRNSSC